MFLIIFIAAGSALLALFAYMDVTQYKLINDTNATVELSNCGIDPIDLTPGASITIGISNAADSCGVDSLKNGTYHSLGCLDIPKGLKSNFVLKISNANAKKPQNSC
jgi:hypothetical protein